ncbi:MAG: hypothetical protein ABI824_08435 [Acidobacteriota bacterium]
MQDNKALKLFKEVLAKTRAGRIQWNATEIANQYSSGLPSGHRLVSSSLVQIDDWGKPDNEFSLALCANENELLRVTSAVDGVDWPDLQELHELARRSALGVNEELDQVLGELAKL